LFIEATNLIKFDLDTETVPFFAFYALYPALFSLQGMDKNEENMQNLLLISNTDYFWFNFY